LHTLAEPSVRLAFEERDSVVIGRGGNGSAHPDIDLDILGAVDLGVSRRHCLLRPTSSGLFLVDMDSANGTLHNGVPLGPGSAYPLHHYDTISLGRLHFIVRVWPVPQQTVVAESGAAGTQSTAA
jgi:pSer/pThr/pTyr-binding forkhead associated (FHA) protein